MQSSTFTLEVSDGVKLFVYRWLPAETPKAVVQIAHGWAEHAARYIELAGTLCEHGYAVYADDHRGHGRTARSPDELGYFAERDGWNRCVGDLATLRQYIATEHPGLPVFAFGHSLGSFMMQQFVSDHGASLAGVALSATNGKPPPLALLGWLIARIELLRVGSHGKSKLLHHLSFGVLNKSFTPARTSFDWLSRDPAEVDKYRADPFCGFASQIQLYLDVLYGLSQASRPDRQARIPQQLPLYIFHGSRDPVAANIQQLLAAYRAVGLANVTYHVYPDARHETLHETNRAEVTRDLVTWLDGVLARR